MATCSIDDCDGAAVGRGWCKAHYARWRRHGTPIGGGPRSQRGRHSECRVAGCCRPVCAWGYCKPHYYRQRKGRGELAPDRPIKAQAPPGSGHVTEDGYRIMYADGRAVFEHVLVVEAALGRRLRPEETVHHKNGQRLDNLLSNLELWSSSHPSGQRVEDLVAWARELLEVYG